ncbi:DUF2061 domain-containing protein [Magnetofaba australis]|uniref:DUF2061 domain-containing protein n=1 Tax=Magnetofaba australis IT-1 TaxID=1434232 RepID=A0A1Y2K078_9PROT|nr:DUF2061 domain-containing protein [Magnetofaba australis]OSM01362.1 hypothetical protein MAIT1_01298 [Magnetofaba australis IT-1]
MLPHHEESRFVTGERVMESRARSIAKTASWRILATMDTFLISWVITGSLKFAGGIASLEVFTKLALYYGHERAWSRVLWGREGEKRPAAPVRLAQSVTQ